MGAVSTSFRRLTKGIQSWRWADRVPNTLQEGGEAWGSLLGPSSLLAHSALCSFEARLTSKLTWALLNETITYFYPVLSLLLVLRDNCLCRWRVSLLRNVTQSGLLPRFQSAMRIRKPMLWLFLAENDSEQLGLCSWLLKLLRECCWQYVCFRARGPGPCWGAGSLTSFLERPAAPFRWRPVMDTRVIICGRL